ncbi:MAG TPA: HNH endonuclease [Usitatibacter sp.]|jgi:putative restriction endonuclease|nr:HNH endonuclease [Usitatibacter sp.]
MSQDQEIRQAAFFAVQRRAAIRNQLTSADLKSGFPYQGNRLPLVNPQRGIFKPKEMDYLLSLRTVVPRQGARVWYDDQREAHKQIYEGDELVEYAFMGKNPESADNRWLREAMVDKVPFIYFLGTAPTLYQPIIPTFISDWDPVRLRARLSFGLPGTTQADPGETTMERRYALREVKMRLHQATFRAAVISAYGGRCAVSGLPESTLLDAAHIAADKDEEFGQPIIQNGLPLTKLHHAAFDGHLIGITPDYEIVVSDRLLEIRDGPTMEAVKGLHHKRLILPARAQDLPDKNRLAMRFEEFRQAN